jgi:uncharacterized membrane protein (Fun14 family)
VALVDVPDLTQFAPYLQQLSFGALAGFAAGYALKKVGKLAAIALGLLFVALQILAYYGFVTINWTSVQERVNPVLEGEALNRLWHGLVEVLTYNITFAAAFVPGLIFGLKRG